MITLRKACKITKNYLEKQDSNNVYCPILSKKILTEICNDVANVAEDFHPERLLIETH